MQNYRDIFRLLFVLVQAKYKQYSQVIFESVVEIPHLQAYLLSVISN